MDKFKIFLHYLLPKKTLTTFLGRLAEIKGHKYTPTVIRWFIKQYKVDMSEYLLSKPQDFDSFNEFFTRSLKPTARPIDQDKAVLSFPADACVSQFGLISGGQIIQAKNRYYSASELLCGVDDLSRVFDEGDFTTFYLAPRDYHRVHMPCDGTLRQMIYVPGSFFSVNPFTAEHVLKLFARNERVICIFDTEFGTMAQVLVGATVVGNIHISWMGTVTSPHTNIRRYWNYPADGERSIKLKKGEEMGYFKLGSTVINLFSKDSIKFEPSVTKGSVTKVGMPFARKV